MLGHRYSMARATCKVSVETRVPEKGHILFVPKFQFSWLAANPRQQVSSLYISPAEHKAALPNSASNSIAGGISTRVGFSTQFAPG